jgi:M6 family metalloprotease-like protein
MIRTLTPRWNAAARAWLWIASVIASGMIATAHAQRPGEAVAHARPDQHLSLTNTPKGGLAARRPLRGTLGMPIIAGTFADVTPKFHRAVYDTAFFGSNAGVGPYSVARYYREVSLGSLSFSGATTPWIRLPRSRASYVDGDPATVWQRYGEFARDLLQRADAIVDWRRYDNDGPDGMPNSGDDDGAVDIAVLLQPGSEYRCGADSLRGFRETGYRLSLLPGWNGQPYVTKAIGAAGRPIIIDDFVGASAVACQDGEIVPTRVNIPVHEIGHVLGLPDLYDYDGSSFGVGGWDIMGIWAAPAARPPHFGAWARERLGWAAVRHVSASGRVELKGVASGGDLVRIDLNGSREYVLLEHRTAQGADASAPGTGLLIWHVNEAVLDARPWGINDDERRPAVQVIQADGRDDLAARANVGDDGDPFPGSSEIVAISDASVPGLLTSEGIPTGIRIDGIAIAGDRVTFDVTFSDATIVAAEAAEVLKSLTVQQALRAVVDPASLDESRRRALDSIGNRNGRVDVGDVIRFRRMLEVGLAEASNNQ